MLRGGAFKPRTSPVRFPGPGRGGPEAAGRGARGDRPADRHRGHGHRRRSTLVAEYADILQIGARNMQNFALLEASGELGKPVLLKRGISATIEEC